MTFIFQEKSFEEKSEERYQGSSSRSSSGKKPKVNLQTPDER